MRVILAKFAYSGIWYTGNARIGDKSEKSYRIHGWIFQYANRSSKRLIFQYIT